MMKLVISVQHGGFGLSDAAYEKLHEWGVPIKKYAQGEKGEVIFDRALEEDSVLNNSMRRLDGRYWEDWTRVKRNHPLLVRVVEEMGDEANGRFAKLRIVEIPDDVDWQIEEYDGWEHVAEKHRTWEG